MDKLIHQLTDILRKRDEIFPARHEQNSREMHRLLDEFFASIDKSPPLPPQETAIDSLQNCTFGENGVFLAGYMKSGTTLLLELFDGHNEVVSLPGDSFMMQRLKKQKVPSPQFWEQWRQNWLKRMVNPTGQRPFWILGQGYAPYRRFLEMLDYWYNRFSPAVTAPIVATVYAYYCANDNRPQKPVLWMEKTPGNEFLTDSIVKFFPRARFIHIVRDPWENMASLKKLFDTRGWQWNPRGIARILGLSLAAARRNRERLGSDRYHVLRYEDLPRDPLAAMTELADFLKIDWSDSLLVPTVNGIQATANSMYKDRSAIGFIKHSTEKKWKKVLNREEEKHIRSTLYQAEPMGYTWPVSIPDRVRMIYLKAFNFFYRNI